MTLSKRQKDELSENPNISKVTDRQVHFTYEFKLLALKQLAQGHHPDEILYKAGINYAWFREGYAKNLFKNWRKIVKAQGVRGLWSNSGRPKVLKPSFKYDPDNLEDLTNQQLVEIIELQKQEMALKKNSIFYTKLEIEVGRHYKNEHTEDEYD